MSELKCLIRTLENYSSLYYLLNLIYIISYPAFRPDSLSISLPNNLTISRPNSMSVPMSRPNNLPMSRPNSLPMSRPNSLPMSRPNSLPMSRPNTLCVPWTSPMDDLNGIPTPTSPFNGRLPAKNIEFLGKIYFNKRATILSKECQNNFVLHKWWEFSQIKMFHLN